MNNINTFIGKSAIDFTAKAIMPDNSINDVFNLKSYLGGQKGILFFYPLDFTFVCPSEIIAFNNRLEEFTNRKTKIISVSVDSHFSHHAWKATSLNKGGIGNVQFPMVSDLDKAISTSYNVLNEDSVAFRGTFLIDQEFKIRHYLINDLALGRDIDETLRIIDALDFHTSYGEVCPAGWKDGQKGMKPTTQGVSEYLGSNAEKL